MMSVEVFPTADQARPIACCYEVNCNYDIMKFINSLLAILAKLSDHCQCLCIYYTLYDVMA